MRILVVDDDPCSGRILAKHLQKVGECDLAPGGREAVRLFRKSFREDYPFDLICLDIIMPGMDGQEVLTELRAIESQESVAVEDRAKILMVSALDDNETVIKSFLHLCDGYLIKPIDKHSLRDKLREIGIPG